jgi:hypothetical protein
MVSEPAARWLLVLHTALGVAAVGAATHLFLWLRRYVRGEAGRRRAVVRFAWLVLALQLAAFACGNLMYPTYKVEVRAAYLENAPAITAGQTEHAKQLAKLGARVEGDATVDLVRRAAQAAHWFDIKEHWVALGCAASLALWILSRKLHPKDQPRVLPLYVGLSAVQCGSAWFGAIVGLVTASYRSVGGPV